MSATLSPCILAQELTRIWSESFAHLDAAEHRSHSLRHKLSEVCFAYYLAILCGHRTYKEAAEWMSGHGLAFARTFKSGHWHRPPHAHTLSRVLRGMAPGALEAMLGAALKGQGEGKHLAMDGKADRSDGQMYLTVYQPWTGEVLGQLPFEIGQEIAAFEKALGLLRKGGKYKVTGDAIHTQIATFQEAKKKTSCC
jgi:hypothetical protein